MIIIIINVLKQNMQRLKIIHVGRIQENQFYKLKKKNLLYYFHLKKN